VHNSGMSHHVPTLLKKMIEALPGKGTQIALAERLTQKGRDGVKIEQPQVSRWMKGQEPDRKNYDRIVSVAKAMGVLTDVRSEDVASALPGPPERKAVKLKGYVGAGAEAHFYALADEDFEEVEAPLDATDQTIAVEIKGKSWGPQMDGWLVFYDDIRSPITEDMFGRTCVVGLADDRILLKTIKRERDGSFTLLSNSNEPPIPDAEIEWAAKVINMRPR